MIQLINLISLIIFTSALNYLIQLIAWPIIQVFKLKNEILILISPFPLLNQDCLKKGDKKINISFLLRDFI